MCYLSHGLGCTRCVISWFVTADSQEGPWNEPVLAFAALFPHLCRARRLFDGCERADQSQAVTCRQDARSEGGSPPSHRCAWTTPARTASREVKAIEG